MTKLQTNPLKNVVKFSKLLELAGAIQKRGFVYRPMTTIFNRFEK